MKSRKSRRLTLWCSAKRRLSSRMVRQQLKANDAVPSMPTEPAPGNLRKPLLAKGAVLRGSRSCGSRLAPQRARCGNTSKVCCFVRHVKDLDENGESEVMLHIAPKVVTSLACVGTSPCRSTGRYPDLERFSGVDFGINLDKFAYFTLSLVWLTAVHDWEIPDRWILPRMAMGGIK